MADQTTTLDNQGSSVHDKSKEDLVYTILNPHIDAGRLLPMFAAHSEEMYGDQGNFDICHLQAMANADLVRIFAVQNCSGQYIGYAMFLLNRDIFKAHKRQAECIAFYVRPEYRNLVIASKLMRHAENALAYLDKVVKVVTTTSNNKSLQAFYERLGYSVTNVQVTKEL